MDDTYLKTVFWLIVILYTAAVIGIWENFAKPLAGLSAVYLGPLFSYLGTLLVIK
ncbi:MAG: hypothetical protein WCT26_02465 [Candidatus Buchananbacteria bacterium]|jgi:hypothetical protein